VLFIGKNIVKHFISKLIEAKSLDELKWPLRY